MSISSNEVLKGFHNLAKAVGDKSMNSDAFFEIEGYPASGILIKQFPWPVITPAGEAEMAGPMGSAFWQPQQLKTNQQGQVTIHETVTGAAQQLLTDIVSKGGRFNATVYEGSPDKFWRAVKIRDAFIVLDPVDRDWENRSQVTAFSGTLFFHYFGETLPGNILPV